MLQITLMMGATVIGTYVADEITGTESLPRDLVTVFFLLDGEQSDFTFDGSRQTMVVAKYIPVIS